MLTLRDFALLVNGGFAVWLIAISVRENAEVLLWFIVPLVVNFVALLTQPNVVQKEKQTWRAAQFRRMALEEERRIEELKANEQGYIKVRN